MLGNIKNYYKDGISHCHAKPFYQMSDNDNQYFVDFMYKHNDFKNLIPRPVFDKVSPEAPKYNQVNVNIIEWMNRHNTGSLEMPYLLRTHCYTLIVPNLFYRKLV